MGHSAHRTRNKKTDRKRTDWGNNDIKILKEAGRTFINGYSVPQMEQATEKFQKGGSSYNLRRAGEMWAEIAGRSDATDEQKSNALDRAKRSWHEVLRNQNLSSDILQGDCGRAMVHLAFLPQYNWFGLSGQLAPKSDNVKTYNQLIDIGTEHYKSMNEMARNKQFDSNYRDLVGNLAEIDVLLLLLRFQNKNIDDRSWGVMPALYSGDCGGSRGAHQKNRWDVSVYTQFDQQQYPDLVYKIQVKASNNKQPKSNEYTDDITMVYAGNDLSLEKYRRLDLSVIPQNCENELRGNEYCTENLDTIQELLLDKLN